MSAAVAQLLRAAKARHGPNGELWKRGGGGECGGPRCMALALVDEAFGLSAAWESGLAAIRGVVPHSEEDGLVLSVTHFNDDPERTWPEVAAAYDRAIAAEESIP